MKVMNKIAAITCLALFALKVEAMPIVTLSNVGETTTTVAGTTTIDFNSGSCGYDTCAGDFQIVIGSSSGQYAQPAGTDTKYLTVPNPIANGSATFSLGSASDYFGLYWGSIDSYNTIKFYLGDSEVASFSGVDIVGATYANGDQVSLNSNRYVNFDFGTDMFDTVKFLSTNFAFESDNHAFRNLVSVPESSPFLLLLAGLVSLILVRSRKQ
jgi:hypothetical protein